MWKLILVLFAIMVVAACAPDSDYEIEEARPFFTSTAYSVQESEVDVGIRVVYDEENRVICYVLKTELPQRRSIGDATEEYRRWMECFDWSGFHDPGEPNWVILGP